MSKPKNKKFWNTAVEEGVAGTEGHLYLYGIISSESWWGDEVTPKMLRDDITALGDIDSLNVHIFSDGGDVFAGLAIYAILKQQSAEVNVYIEGIAASIATVVAMGGENIYISRSAMMMIHNPMTLLFGYYNENDMAAIVAELQKIREPLIATYQSRTGLSREEVIAAMDGDNGSGTWYSADEAIAAGLADEYIPVEIDEAIEAVAKIGRNRYEWNGITLDLSAYKNAPKLKIKKDRRSKDMAKLARKQPLVAKARRIRAEITSVTCPECGATFDIEVGIVPEPSPEEGGEPTETAPETEARRGRKHSARKFKNELVEVTCPECGAVFTADVSVEPEADPAEVLEPGDGGDGTGEETVDSYKLGIMAERQRLTSLDGIAAAMPDAADIVARAKTEGWTYEATCRMVMDAKAEEQRTNRNSGEEFLRRRENDYKNSGIKNISAVANSGMTGAQDTAVKRAADMIAAGFRKK